MEENTYSFTVSDNRGRLVAPIAWYVQASGGIEPVTIDFAFKEDNTRGLYEVYVVDPEADEVMVAGHPVIARTAVNAKLKTLLDWDIKQDPDDLDIIVHCVGGVREKKQVQAVKVVKDSS